MRVPSREPEANGSLVTSGFFALRTPLTPFTELERWTEGLGAPQAAAAGEGLEEALVRDRTLLRRRLAAFVSRPEVREALFVASPDLDGALESWEREPEGEKGRRAERSLVKYLARMVGRPSPFGLFAGTSVGTVGESTRIAVASRTESRRSSRLDLDFLVALVDSLLEGMLRDAELPCRPNSSLYLLGGRWRFVETALRGRERSYRLAEVEDSEIIRTALAHASRGVCPAEMAAAVVDEDVSPEDAAAFVRDLLDAQLLVPDAGLHLTGEAPGARLAERLSSRPETAQVGEALSAAASELARFDAVGAPPSDYRALGERLAALPGSGQGHRLFQVDVVPECRATVGPAVLDEIERGARLLQRLARPADRTLAAFREAFLERYERREVPLAQALDEETGIGFPVSSDEDPEGEPLAAGLPQGSPPGDDSTPWGARERFVLGKLQEAWAKGATEIVLGARDLDEVASRSTLPLPDAFAVVARLAARSEEALDRGDFRLLLIGVDGPSGACVLGRFCHANPDLHRFVERHLRQEEALAANAVFAEVVHLPEARTGNILLRPVLRDYEIPYLGASGAPPERQIPVSDLLLSVVGDELRLSSKRLGKRVIARITTAHNYTAEGLSLYRFLGELQTQGVAVGRPWDWGPFRGAPFLPRVTSGRIVLSRARWTVEAGALERLSRLNGAARYLAVQGWREERRLPRLVLLAEGDAELPFDLEAELSVDALLHSAKGLPSFELVEMFPGPGELVARGPEGAFVHELVVPFVRAAPDRDEDRPSGACARRPGGSPVAVERSFPPGSEWLTAKIYCGVATADRLLGEVLGPLVRRAREEGLADLWFFLRYADPRPHLRLRLHGDGDQLAGRLVPRLRDALEEALRAGQVWKLQLDTYQREVERYGGPEAIERAEQLFCADSDAVLEILECLEEGSSGAEERWRLCLRGVDMLLDDLGLDLGAKRALVERGRTAFGERLGLDASLSRALGARYRSLSREIEILLDPAHDSGSPLAAGFDALRERSRRSQPAIEALSRLDAQGRLTLPLSTIAASMVHLHVNRILRSAHRKQELVVYDLLSRHYARRVARAAAQG